MIVIDRNKCSGCGRCASIRITLQCLRDQDNFEVYAEPPESDMAFVERVMAECYSHCIYLHK